jgi:hypothetical protein
MKHRALLLASLLLISFATAVFALDMNGKWKGTMTTPNGDLEVNMSLKVEGEKVTGTVGNTYGEEQITEGVVKGDEVSFVVMAGGGQFRIVYKGKVTGEDIKFKITLGDFGDSEMVAKRVS